MLAGLFSLERTVGGCTPLRTGPRDVAFLQTDGAINVPKSVHDFPPQAEHTHTIEVYILYYQSTSYIYSISYIKNLIKYYKYLYIMDTIDKPTII
jgi:hypothetical protein